MTLAYDSIASTTLQAIRPRLADNVFMANRIAFWLLASGRVKTQSGGKWIETPLMYTKNPTVRSYKGWEPLTVAATDELTMVKYHWRQFAGSVSISGLEELENSGKEAFVNLLKAKITVLEKSMREYFNEILLTPDAGKDLLKDFLGLPQLIQEGVWGTVGGIDRSAYTWWRNVYKTGTLANMSRDLRTFKNDCTQQLTEPDLMLTDQTSYETYEDQNSGRLILRDNKLIDVGFANLKIGGTTLMWEPAFATVRSGVRLVYCLNTESLGVTLHSKRNFVMGPFVKPHNQDGRVAQMMVAGNMTLDNSRFQGVMILS